MVTVENVRGGRYYHRETGLLTTGDRADVGEALAAYLCDERGEFERVNDADTCGAEQSDGSTCERPADDCPYHGED